jgi:hypothetical protein
MRRVAVEREEINHSDAKSSFSCTERSAIGRLVP